MKANRTTAKPTAITTVDHSSREVTASAGTVIANASGKMKVTPKRSQPGKIDVGQRPAW